MPEASNIPISTSGSAGLFATGSIGGLSAGIAPSDKVKPQDTISSGDMGLQGGFQAVLNAQPGQGATTPPPAATVAGPAPELTDADQEAATSPVSASPVAAMPIAAALGLNGNLPVGGKILPVAATVEDNPQADVQEPAAAADKLAMIAKPSAAKPTLAQSRKADQTAGAPLEDGKGKVTDDAEDSDDGQAVDANAAPAANLAPSPIPMPIAMGSPSALAATPTHVEASTAKAPDLSTMAIHGGQTSTPGSQASLDGANTTDKLDAGNGVAPAQHPTNASASALQEQSTPAQAPVPTASAVIDPAALLSPTLAMSAQPKTPQVATDQAAQIKPLSIGKAGLNGRSMPGAAAASPSEAVSATQTAPERSELAGKEPNAANLALTPASDAAIQDASLPTGDASGASSPTPTASAPRMDVSAMPESSRDMSALVDRLVETRAALRAGAPAQWVQTSVQHAEFGRVALQIRQDGDHLSVAMASQDPGFATSAQAALQASHSLLQPAAPGQNTPDSASDNRQNGQQAAYQDPSGQPAPNGQSGMQTGGQNQQTPGRQQRVFTPEQQTIAPQAQTRTESSDSAPAGRSGILA